MVYNSRLPVTSMKEFIMMLDTVVDIPTCIGHIVLQKIHMTAK